MTIGKKTAAFLLAPTIGAGLATWAFRSKPYTIKADGCATPTAAGWLRLALMRQLIKATGLRPTNLPKVAMRTIDKRMVPTTYGPAEITLYWPETSTADLLPVYVNLHGGGFVIGYYEQDDRLCRYWAHHAPCVVINVDYVLAPEYPFPAPVWQCYEVVRWVHAHASELGYDASHLVVGGHSAGGNLAAAVALLQRERREFPLALQVLDYAPLNMAKPSDQKHVLPHKKQVLSVELAQFFSHLYLSCPADRQQPLASPVLAPEAADLAPALIIAAEDDLLRDDSREYAAKLRQEGVAVTYREFAGVDHAFTHVGPKESALQAWDLILSALQKAFGTNQQVEEQTTP